MLPTLLLWPHKKPESLSKMNALALESLLEILVSVMLVLTWTAAVIWGNVLFFLVYVAAVDVEEKEEEEEEENEVEEDGRPITVVGVLHVLLFLVVIGLVILERLLDSLNWTDAFVMAGYGVAISLVLRSGVEEIEEVEEYNGIEDDGVEDDGVEDDGVEDDGHGCPSGTVIQTKDSAWTLEDGCSAGDAIETDALRSVEEDTGRPITATGAVPFTPRRSPRLAAGCSAGDAIETDALGGIAEENGRQVKTESPFEPRLQDDHQRHQEPTGILRRRIEGCMPRKEKILHPRVSWNLDGIEEWTVDKWINQTEDSAWTLEDGCSAGDAIETDDLRIEEDTGRPITATVAVPFTPRCSPRLAAQTQTRVEPRRSPRLAANRKRADSLRNAGSQPRRSARLAAIRLTRGV
jgi:hypothetical protein